MKHPVSNSGLANFFFSRSASIPNNADELTGEQIGSPAHTPAIDPKFDGDSITIRAESPAALYDYETITYADLWEITQGEEVSALAITGKTTGGVIASLAVSFQDETPGDADPWDACGGFTVTHVSPDTIRQFDPYFFTDPIIFKTAGKMPVKALKPDGSEAAKGATIKEVIRERVEFVDGWATLSNPVWCSSTAADWRYDDDGALENTLTGLASGGGIVYLVGGDGVMPSAAWNAFIGDVARCTTKTKDGSKKIFVQAFADLEHSKGIIAEAEYITKQTFWSLRIPVDWYTTNFPVIFKFESCPDKEHFFPVEVLREAGDPRDILVRWTDRDTQEAVEGVAISIGIDGGALSYKGLTDVNGELTIPSVPIGTHTIVGVKSGYKRSDEDSMAQNDSFTVEVL